MTEAYRKVMMSKYDREKLNEDAVRKRVQRFFNTFRMREAMSATPGELGEKARQDFEKYKRKQLKPPKRYDGDPKGDSSIRILIENQKYEDKKKAEKNAENTKAQIELMKSDRDKWLESLNVCSNPSAMTIYGTGQFLAYVAVKEIMARQNAIKERGIDVLSKEGSALTPNIISALKTAAAMVLPFAPAPSAEDRREMSKAAVLLGLFPDNIKEDPDAYTAPIPATVDLNAEE
jgi:hypothetical protein